MGYRTDFDGALKIEPAPTPEFITYINDFSETRRIKRDPELIRQEDPDWEKHCFNGELGVDGGYYIPYPIQDFGQNKTSSVVDINCPPADQPGLWCDWHIEDNHLCWNWAEKFYSYDDWLEYLIEHFFKPQGYTLNGTIRWRGEDFDDNGALIVKDNKLTVEYR